MKKTYLFRLNSKGIFVTMIGGGGNLDAFNMCFKIFRINNSVFIKKGSVMDSFLDPISSYLCDDEKLLGHLSDTILSQNLNNIKSTAYFLSTLFYPNTNIRSVKKNILLFIQVMKTVRKINCGRIVSFFFDFGGFYLGIYSPVFGGHYFEVFLIKNSVMLKKIPDNARILDIMGVGRIEDQDVIEELSNILLLNNNNYKMFEKFMKTQVGMIGFSDEYLNKNKAKPWLIKGSWIPN